MDLMGLLIMGRPHRLRSVRLIRTANEVRVDVKKVLLLVAAAVLIYTLIAHPTQLGDGVQAIFGWITDGIAAIGDFLKSIVN